MHALVRLELFVVAAISAILLTRGYLILMDYPQLGSDGLHIAHMLWGGLLMLVSHVLLLGFLGPRVKELSALIGGFGFGLFIDEVGKFVTADNDYFFQPSFAIMYVVFVLLVLVMHGLSERRPRDSGNQLANAAAIGASGQLHGLDDVARAEALQLTEAARAGGADERSVIAVRAMITASRNDEHGSGHYATIRAMFLRTARIVVRSRAAYLTVVGILLVQVGDALVDVIRVMVDNDDDLTTAGTLRLGYLLLIAPVIAAGLVSWRWRSEQRGLEILRYAVLLNIMVGQVLNFADNELAAFPGVIVNLGTLAVVNYRLRLLASPPASPAVTM